MGEMPDVRAILNSPLVTSKTKEVLERRLSSGAEPLRFFSAKTADRLLAMFPLLLPEVEGVDPGWCLSQLDTAYAEGRGTGWRWEGVPEGSGAIEEGIVEVCKGIDAHGPAFLDDPRSEDHPWLDTFLSTLVTGFARILYSHPLAQQSIGYTGFADGLGWKRIGLDERESWEAGSSNGLPHGPPTEPDMVSASAGNRYSMAEEVDLVIVGSGAGGAPLAARLCAAGLKVVLLEAGKHWRPAEDFATDEREQEKLYWLDERLSGGGDPIAFGGNNSGIGVGGTTLHYTAFVPRPSGEDFRISSTSGVGVDWPFGLQDLQPYLEEVERFIGVSGPSPYPWDSARRYPLGPLPLNSSAELMRRGCQVLGVKTAPGPNAALSQPYYVEGVGWRGPCVNRGFCQAGCNRGAKGSTDVTFIASALTNGLDLRPECFALEIEMRGHEVAAIVYESGGQLHKQRCKSLFLCCGAIESPRLLLMNGLGNESGQVGKNFMAHGSTQVWGFFDEETRPWKGIPGGLISEDFRHSKDYAGGFILQSIGVMPLAYVEAATSYGGLRGAELGAHMAKFNHLAGIDIHAECLPHQENRIQLSNEKDSRGLPKPLIRFTMHENEKAIAAHGEAVMRDIWTAARAQEIWSYPRQAHTLGTCRMGVDPESSVVDPTCRVHGFKNLYVCDTSIYPSSLTANPALTMMAISLRTADLFLEADRRQ